ncbi:MAG: regulatory iron-sulfur-containing complex subunit RicT [bacterium]
MASIIEIEFKGLRRAYFANPQEFPFQLEDMAVVQVEKGEDLGVVVHLGWRKGAEHEELPSYQLLRKARAEDLETLQRNRAKESEALLFSRRKARERNLEMKFVDVELQWDSRKMTFFFTADGRIDFRELVKDFAAAYRTRIDLRQIGARDETKKKGGYGSCGLTLCCATWLSEFHPITTQMPRDQSLLLNPMRLSGVCGRLKCCLRFELDSYRDFLEHCPVLEQKVLDSKKGEGMIEKLDMILEQIHIRYEGGETEKFSLTEFEHYTDWKRGLSKEHRITISGRPQPVVEPEAEPLEAPPKERPAPVSVDAVPPTKKERQKEVDRRPPRMPRRDDSLSKAKSTDKNSDEPAKSTIRKSRRRHRRKAKSPSETKPPS